MSLAAHHAKSLLKKLEINSLPIDPFDISERMGIFVKEDDCEGYTGMILVVDDRALISIKSGIREHSRKKFTVAHELGHYSIPEHLAGRTFFKCTDKDLNTFDKKDSKESEANDFAAEFLMPEELFRERIMPKDLSYGLIEELIDEFETSLTATGIRFVKLSGDYALVCSEKSRIKWFIKGDEFPFYLRADGRLDKESIAIEHFKGKNLPKSFETVPAYVWLDDYKLKEDMEVQELAIALPYYNQVLSFIYAETSAEDEEDEYLEELDGYPRFKR
jgi:Zn-dependent peptidase ImmA (M78 family)